MENLSRNIGRMIHWKRKDIPQSSEVSRYTYSSPIKPRSGENVRFWQDSPAHIGPFRYAVDIIIPDPRLNPLPVYAPMSGEVIAIEQSHEKFGNGPEYLNDLNYITIKVDNDEFYELCHIGKDSAKDESGQELIVGSRVKQGQVIATTGVNGWMTDARHIHFMVGRNNESKEGFESVRINFSDAPNPYTK